MLGPDLESAKQSEIEALKKAINDPKTPTNAKYVMLLRLETLPGRMNWLNAVVNDKTMKGIQRYKTVFDSTVAAVVIQIVEAVRNSTPSILVDLLDDRTKKNAQEAGQKAMLEAIIERIKTFNETVTDKHEGNIFATADCGVRKEH